MGYLDQGKWTPGWYSTKNTGGKFVRSQAQFRNWITADGSAGPTGEEGFKAETDRYHLYVSLACPWAHRTLIFRRLKQLENFIGVSIVDPEMPEETGWAFSTREGATKDTLYGLDFAHQIYTKADPTYSGRVTVPILWDKVQETIVSNESSEIIRMFNSAFNALTGDTRDFYPQGLRTEIDAVNERVYHAINNGVYKSGFATTQSAYEEAVTELFDALDWVDARLANQPYLAGDQLTEADWRLFTTLIRFDLVYHGHFKCNISRIADYKHIQPYMLGLYRDHGIEDTVNFDHIKHHYYWSHTSINPHRIVPRGPQPPK